jgi:hypothetical protein
MTKDNPTSKIEALVGRLRTHSDRVQGLAWTQLKNDLVDAAGVIDKQAQAIRTALEHIDAYDDVEGSTEILDKAAETLRGAT